MKIKRLVIENFKSIERIELIEPNPFTVFVGPNGSGKSNIFEAMAFVNFSKSFRSDLFESFFGGANNFLRRQSNNDQLKFECELDDFTTRVSSSYSREAQTGQIKFIGLNRDYKEPTESPSYEQFYRNFTRLFIRNGRIPQLPLNDDKRLALDADNLEKVLKRILRDEVLRNEIFEWLELFVPGFKAVEIDDRNELHWFEESIPNYFTKDLISDGTYNILAMLTAVYQSDDKPQFLCIEEPENGLHPQVARELVDFFRIMCEERGHYIWLNTHSQSMASRVRPNEFVVVEKEQGATTTRQFKKEDFSGMRVDEAWLTNALNGGLAW